jgi:hypothetical protein
MNRREGLSGLSQDEEADEASPVRTLLLNGGETVFTQEADT